MWTEVESSSGIAYTRAKCTTNEVTVDYFLHLLLTTKLQRLCMKKDRFPLLKAVRASSAIDDMSILDYTGTLLAEHLEASLPREEYKRVIDAT